jgi:hypothetical protein
MPTPAGPDDAGSLDLTIELAVASGQTKTVHRIKQGGSIKFKNGSQTGILTIASPAAEAPFVPPDCVNAVSSFEVGPGAGRTVTISEAYEVGASFTYTAQIEGSLQEDPIVIIERR